MNSFYRDVIAAVTVVVTVVVLKVHGAFYTA